MIPHSLRRYPHDPRSQLLAWDAADDLLIEHAASLPLEGKRILVLNDTFGAIACALLGHDVTSYTDSYLSAYAAKLNSQDQVRTIHELSKLEGIYDHVFMRVPKNMSFFEDELAHLTHHLRPGTEIVCAYMIKHQANSSFELLARLIGPTRTSLAKKKARLIFAPFEKSPTESPYPLAVEMEGFEAPIINHSNVFSREKLDIGTRFFLEHIPEHPDFRSILDLGCGNGLIGIAAASLNPEAEISFADESWMALASVRANTQDEGGPDLFWTHACDGIADETFDLVLCNPPFHQGMTVGDGIAREMMKGAHRVLKPGGTLRVIGNLHLDYPVLLERIFGSSEIVAQNAKFTIVDAQKGQKGGDH